MAAPKGNQYALGNNGGVPKAIASPDILWSLFEDFKKHIKSNPKLEHDFVGKDAVSVRREKEVPLTMERFECWLEDLGIISQLTHYLTNYEGRYEEFVGVCTRIKREIRADQIEGGMCSIYNTSITQRLNGLAEKVESKVTEEDPIPYDDLSEDTLNEIAAAIKKRKG